MIYWTDPMFRILERIYEYNQRNDPIWEDKLVQIIPGMGYVTVNRALDQLSDLHFISTYWEVVDGKWTNTLRVSDSGLMMLYTLENERK